MSGIELNPSALGMHIVPVGATIPAGAAFMFYDDSGWRITCWDDGITQKQGSRDRWTAEPLAAPSPTLAGRVRALLDDDSFGYWAPASVALVGLIAELAEKVEAQS